MHRGGGAGWGPGAARGNVAVVTHPFPRELNGRAFTTREAHRCGVTAKMLRRASLRAPFAGVRVGPAAPDSFENLCRAASTFLPDGALFSHVTALRLIGVELPRRLAADERVHVTVPAGQPVPRRAAVVAHTNALGPLPTWRHELPVASPATVWVQLGAWLGVDDLVVLADAMTRRKDAKTTLAILRSHVGAAPPGTRGIRSVRSALEMVRPGTDSSMESRARLVLVHASLPCPDVNEPVYDGFGRFVALPDMSYPGLKIAIEYDGDIHRTDRATWRRDIARRQALEALGWRVITCTADDVLRFPARLVAWVRAAISRSWLARVG